MVFRGLGCGLSPFWGFCVPIGLVWSYDIRSVRGYSIHSLSHTPVGLIHLFIQLSALGWFPPPSKVFACLSGLAWMFGARSVQDYSVHPLSLSVLRVSLCGMLLLSVNGYLLFVYSWLCPWAQILSR